MKIKIRQVFTRVFDDFNSVEEAKEDVDYINDVFADESFGADFELEYKEVEEGIREDRRVSDIS